MNAKQRSCGACAVTRDEQAAFLRARAVVEAYEELFPNRPTEGPVTGLLEDLATYQRKVGVCTLALLAQSAVEVDRRRAQVFHG